MPLGDTQTITRTELAIATAASGAAQLVALTAGAKIRIVQLVLTSLSANFVTFQSHTTTATKFGPIYLAANGGVVLPFSEIGWFSTVAGEALDINLNGATAVGGILTYILV